MEKNNNELKVNAKIAIDNKDFLESKEDLLDELATFRNEKKLSEIATVEEKYGISYENPDEKVMIDRVLAKDIDLELMETLTSKRAAIKESNSKCDCGYPWQSDRAGVQKRNSGEVFGCNYEGHRFMRPVHRFQRCLEGREYDHSHSCNGARGGDRNMDRY